MHYQRCIFNQNIQRIDEMAIYPHLNKLCHYLRATLKASGEGYRVPLLRTSTSSVHWWHFSDFLCRKLCPHKKPSRNIGMKMKVDLFSLVWWCFLDFMGRKWCLHENRLNVQLASCVSRSHAILGSDKFVVSRQDKTFSYELNPPTTQSLDSCRNIHANFTLNVILGLGHGYTRLWGAENLHQWTRGGRHRMWMVWKVLI